MARHAPKSKRQSNARDTGSTDSGQPGPNKSEPKKGRGRPAFTPTPDQRTLVAVSRAASYTEEEIAGLINFPHGIAVETLKKYFKTELAQGARLLNINVVGNLYRMAQRRPNMDAMGRPTQPEDKGAVTAAIFLAKTRLGWRDVGMAITPPAGSSGSADISPDGRTLSFTLKLGDGPPAEE